LVIGGLTKILSLGDGMQRQYMLNVLQYDWSSPD
jgi:hypothetical protein